MNSNENCARSPKRADQLETRLALLSDRQLRVLGWAGSLVVALVVAYGVTGFPFATDYGDFIAAGQAPDILHERALAWEALFGDPYRPVGEVMADHGYPAIAGGIAVRTPAAFILQLPLILVSESALLSFAVSAVLLLLIASLKLTLTISEVQLSAMTWLGPAFFISFPAVTAMLFGSVMVLVPVVLVLISWAYRHKPWVGIALGVAAASRLWPVLIIVGLWIDGRKRMATVATVTLLLLTVLGLSLPGVTLAGTTLAIAGGGAAWMANPQNSSLAHVLAPLGIEAWVAVIVASVSGLILAIRHRERSIDITVVSALIASPLSWPAYAVSGLPALSNLKNSLSTILLAAISSPWLVWFLVPSGWRGYAMFASLVGFLVLIVWSSQRRQTHEVAT